MHLTDVADVLDSVEDVRNLALAEGRPAVIVIIFRQPGANVIDTVDRVRAELPHLQASMPSDIEISRGSDRSKTIRASLHDTEWTLVSAVLLVTAIVFLFLRDIRAAIVPIVAVPVSIIGTFGAMYLTNFSLNNLSLMALTIATGFVVDDAIVVLENIKRHIEAGRGRLEAALIGSREVGFTVLSMSLSLIAVFIPILLMGGIIGRLFREFAVTLSLSILISLALSLTLTPLMCALFLRPRPPPQAHLRRDPFAKILLGYERSLGWALRHGKLPRRLRRHEGRYSGYRFPPEIIQQAIWLYLRFTLSFRDVEDLLAERGVVVPYETVRRWVNHFGPMIAADLRKRRPKPHTTWHLDEVYLKIDGRMVYLWRAVDARARSSTCWSKRKGTNGRR